MVRLTSVQPGFWDDLNPIESLDLPDRIHRIFKRRRIKTIGQLRALSDADLLRIPLLGPVALKEVKETLYATAPTSPAKAFGQGYADAVQGRALPRTSAYVDIYPTEELKRAWYDGFALGQAHLKEYTASMNQYRDAI